MCVNEEQEFIEFKTTFSHYVGFALHAIKAPTESTPLWAKSRHYLWERNFFI